MTVIWALHSVWGAVLSPACAGGADTISCCCTPEPVQIKATTCCGEEPSGPAITAPAHGCDCEISADDSEPTEPPLASRDGGHSRGVLQMAAWTLPQDSLYPETPDLVGRPDRKLSGRSGAAPPLYLSLCSYRC